MCSAIAQTVPVNHMIDEGPQHPAGNGIPLAVSSISNVIVLTRVKEENIVTSGRSWQALKISQLKQKQHSR